MSRETLVLRNGKWFNKRDVAPIHRTNDAPMVISDIQEYRAAAADKHTGKRPMIGSRRQHREFLSRNGYAEVGNDYVAPRHEELSRSDRINDIKHSFGE